MAPPRAAAQWTSAWTGAGITFIRRKPDAGGRGDAVVGDDRAFLGEYPSATIAGE